MRAYAIRRLLLLIPTLFIVATMVFFLVKFIPGDIIDALQSGPGADAELDRPAIEHSLGLDAPVIVQYGRWMGFVPQVDGYMTRLGPS